MENIVLAVEVLACEEDAGALAFEGAKFSWRGQC